MKLHILSPLSQNNYSTVLPTLPAGDLVADFSRFPATIYRATGTRAYENITTTLLEVSDPWQVMLTWTADFTRRTGLNDALVLEGYSVWWTPNFLNMTPSLTDFGNSFMWVDFMLAIAAHHTPAQVQLYGNHAALAHLTRQIFNAPPLTICDGRPPQPPVSNLAKLHRPLLVVVRLLLSLIYALTQRPDICVLTGANALRRHENGLKDVYIDDVIAQLRQRGWRVGIVESYGINASWQSLWTRGFFFPSDLVMGLSLPPLHRLFGRPGPWEQRLRELRPRLEAEATYRGCDISPLMLPLIQQAFEQTALFSNAVPLWQWLWRLWQPKLINVITGYSIFWVPAIIAAKTLNIPTLEQQHGIIAKHHGAYLVPPDLRATPPPHVDYMALWGQYVQRLLVEQNIYRPEQLAVCGFPRLDWQFATLSSPVEQVREQLGVLPGYSLVLYASNTIVETLYTDILDSLQQVAETPIHWVIKLHPQEKTHALWQAAITARGLQNISVIEDDLDFYSLLAAADIHISFVSTTIIEAAVLGKLNLGLSLASVPDPVGYEDAGAFLPIAPNEMGLAVEGILQDHSTRMQLHAQQQRFAEDWCLYDGQSVQHIVAFAEAIITTRS